MWRASRVWLHWQKITTNPLGLTDGFIAKKCFNTSFNSWCNRAQIDDTSFALLVIHLSQFPIFGECTCCCSDLSISVVQLGLILESFSWRDLYDWKNNEPIPKVFIFLLDPSKFYRIICFTVMLQALMSTTHNLKFQKKWKVRVLRGTYL